jgi:hypothetical protein
MRLALADLLARYRSAIALDDAFAVFPMPESEELYARLHKGLASLWRFRWDDDALVRGRLVAWTLTNVVAGVINAAVAGCIP